MPNKDREKQSQQPQKQGTGTEKPADSAVARRGDDETLGFHPEEFFNNPFTTMRRMHDEMDRLFASALGQYAGRGATGGLGSWAPAIEVSRKDNEINVCAELPGLQPEDVKIEVTENALVIEGERRHETKEDAGGGWHSERHYGRFFRSIPLPEGAKTGHARADFRNGELIVTVPVDQPQSKRRQIPISGGRTEKTTK